MMNMYTRSRDMEELPLPAHLLSHTHVEIHYFFWIAKSRKHISDLLPWEMSSIQVQLPKNAQEKAPRP